MSEPTPGLAEFSAAMLAQTELARHLQWRHLASLSDYEVAFPLMRQLRQDLRSAASWHAYAQRNHGQGYRLLGVYQDQQLCALASYRLQENLVHGNYLYLEDLVTDQHRRGQGLGEQVLAALKQLARQQGLQRLVLDTLLSNALAHRFYYRQGLLASALRFSQPL